MTQSATSEPPIYEPTRDPRVEAVIDLMLDLTAAAREEQRAVCEYINGGDVDAYEPVAAAHEVAVVAQNALQSSVYRLAEQLVTDGPVR